MALAAVRSKAMILRLFIHCLLLLPLFVGFFCVGSMFCYVVLSVLSCFAINPLGKRVMTYSSMCVVVTFPGHIHLLFGLTSLKENVMLKPGKGYSQYL